MKLTITFLFLSVLILLGETNLELRTKSSNTEGIELSATAETENDGRTLIKCVLTNHSDYILASCGPRTRSGCFRFTLYDKSGEAIPMEKKWALVHAQPDGTNDSALDRRSWIDPRLRPNESFEFHFHLEDAYSQRAKEGEVLEVKWNNISPLQEGYNILKIDAIKDGDRIIVPAYEEENHFPGRRAFEVKLPLTVAAAASQIAPPSAAPAQSDAKSTEEPEYQSRQPNPAPTEDSRPFDRRWLFLLLIPVLFLLRRMFSTRKTT
jgi:hypothetical protein